MLDFNHWIQEFQALSTIALLSGAQIDSPPELSTHLGPLKEQVLSKVAPAAFNLLKQELFKTSSFSSMSKENGVYVSPIQSLLKLNKAILEFFD